jgi:hypothetical protein
VFQLPESESAYLLTDKETGQTWLVYKLLEANLSWDRRSGDNNLVSKWLVLPQTV